MKPQPALIDNTSTRSASYPTKEFKNLLSHDSVLWVLAFKTGRFVKPIALNNIDHVGGITYDEDHKRLWVATINQEQRAQVQSVTLKEIEKYNFKKQKKPIKFEHGTNLSAPLRTSYMTYHKNKLYISYFDKVRGGQLILKFKELVLIKMIFYYLLHTVILIHNY